MKKLRINKSAKNQIKIDPVRMRISLRRVTKMMVDLEISEHLSKMKKNRVQRMKKMTLKHLKMIIKVMIKKNNSKKKQRKNPKSWKLIKMVVKPRMKSNHPPMGN